MPRVSIIIPLRNEERFLARCLDSVLAQLGRRDDVEVLCIDGASTDGTRDLLEAYAGRDPRVRVLANPRGIVPTAMNIGIAAARGDVIIRLDCHAEYAPDYFERCVAVLERTGADNVGGYVATRPGRDTPVGRAIAAATSSPFGVGGSKFRTGGGEHEVDTVPFGCFRRDVFTRFGLYDERLVRNQDIELNSRIRRRGGRIVISPEIRLTYYNRSTFDGLRQQAYHNGLWNAFTLFIVGGGLRLRHFVPLAFVAGVLGLAVAGAFWRPAWGLLAAELLVYAGAGLFMARRATRAAAGPVENGRARPGPAAHSAGDTGSQGRVSTLLVLLAFVNLHLAYGIGTLVGLLSGPLQYGLRRRPAAGPLPDRRD